MPLSRWASSILSLICAETSAPVPKILVFDFFFKNQAVRRNVSRHEWTSGLCVLLQAQGLWQPLVAPICRSVTFCLLLTHHWGGKESLWIISSGILAFIPALKGWGVLQGWCLILAAFVHSGLGKSCMLWSLLCLQQPRWHLWCEKAPTRIWRVNLKV